MKRILFVLAVAWLSSCGGNRQAQTSVGIVEDKELTFEEAMGFAEVAPTTETKTFLGFHLGVSRSEVVSYRDSLLATGKLKGDIYSGFEYIYPARFSGDMKLSVRFYFFRDTLYEVQFTPTYSYAAENGLATTELWSDFIKSGGSDGFLYYKRASHDGDSVRSYMKSNMLVEFSDVGLNQGMRYVDVPRDQQFKDSLYSVYESEREANLAEFR